MRRRLLAAAALLVLPLAACRPAAQAVAEGDDPLAALAVRAESPRYDGPFWAREAHRGSAVWTRAKSFCLAHREDDLPNCRTVALVVRWEQPASLPPLPPLPPLPQPPPPPPVFHTTERGYVAGDVEALKRWEQELLRKNRPAAQGAPR